MNFVAALACLVVAIDSAQMALGSYPQQLFSPDYLWIWWYVGFAWICNCLYFCFQMFKKEPI